MAARVTKCDGTVLTIEMMVDIGGAMLTAEESIQTVLNEAGDGTGTRQGDIP